MGKAFINCQRHLQWQIKKRRLAGGCGGRETTLLYLGPKVGKFISRDLRLIVVYDIQLPQVVVDKMHTLKV